MSAFNVTTNPGAIVQADDSAVQIESYSAGSVSTTGLTFIGNDNGSGAYAGKYGLGKMYAMEKTVRPFRRMISAQSLFRREVYK
jgi:hypothetical protein